MGTFILKLAGIIGATFVSYKLATQRDGEWIGAETHPYLAVFLELGALAIIFG